MTSQATFKESSSRRPWHQRLTSVAWVLIIVVAVSCLAFTLIGGGWALPKLFASDEWATKTPTPTATKTPDPTAGPTGEPTEWWEDGTPTTEPTKGAEKVEPFPAWWADEMAKGDDGLWMAPVEVVEMVRTHYEEETAAYRAFMEASPPDLDGFEEAMPTYFSGAYLNEQRDYLRRIRSGERDAGLCTWGICMITPQDFSADGLSCSMGVACRDGTCIQINPDTGVITSSEPMANSGMTVFRMVYDPGDGHWKIDHRAAYIPPE